MTTYANYGWIVLLPALALWRVVHKRANPKGQARKYVPVVVMLLAVAAGLGFAYTVLAEWTGGLIGACGGLLEQWTKSSDARIGLSVSLVILAVTAAALDIAYDKQADRAAQFSAFIMPTLLLLIIGGSSANAVHTSYGKVAGIVHSMGGNATKGHK